MTPPAAEPATAPAAAPRAASPLAWLETDQVFVGLLLVLVVLVSSAYGLVNGAFHFDDFHNLVENPHVTSLANVPRFFTDASTWSAEPGNTMYRPLQILSYAVDFALWDFRPTGWVLTNALLHAAVALLVWRLARRLGLSPLASVLAGLVFALHPANTEVVNYVSSRSESLAALLMLFALHAHLTARRRGMTSGRGVAWILVACACFALSLLAKETTAFFFAAVLLLELVLARGEPAGRRIGRACLAAAPYLVTLVLMLLLRRAMLGQATAQVALVTTPAGADAQSGGQISVLDNLLKVQTRVVVLYLQILLRPVQLNVDYDVVRTAAWTLSAAVALAIHAAVAAWALAALRAGRRLFPLCVGWFWLLLAPSIAFPLNVVMNEHRLYLPGIAVALLAGAALGRVAELLAARWGTAKGVAVAVAPLVLFLPLDLQRGFEWRSDEVLWTVAVRRAPKSARAHMHLGAAWQTQSARLPPAQRRELLEGAIGEYLRADRLHPRRYDTVLNLGNAYLELGRMSGDRDHFAASLEAFRRAGEIVGVKAARPRYFQAVVLSEMGSHDEAVAMVRALDEEDASTTTLYPELVALILRKKGDKAGAAAAMEQVIAIEEPLHRVDGLLALGWWRFEDGDVPGARVLIDRALKISIANANARRPTSVLPYLYAARMLVLLGMPGAEADGFLEAARKAGWQPDDAHLKWVLGGATPGALRLGTRSMPTYGSPK